MKKKTVFCLFLIIAIVAASLSFNSSAAQNEYEYEGDKYLPDIVFDVLNGVENPLAEINDFDRYERAYEEANTILGAEYKVAFQSGGADHSHQYIAASALRILANDKGDCIYNTSTNSSLIIENADWPDSNDIGFIFDTHFYNPYTEKNYHAGGTTAKVKATKYYNDAVSAYKNGNVTSALETLSRGSHFVQDASEAHHATNKTAVGSNHSAYEKYIDTVRTRITVPDNHFDESIYQEALVCSVGQIVRNNSYASYCLGDKVTGSESNPDYFDAANGTVINAITGTVQYYYKFAVEVGIMNP
ncbi:MAG: hypothetical protein IKE65_02890 [Clostridia bacterium]|nr:hypothetical protein [Clostridia bacterium]